MKRNSGWLVIILSSIAACSDPASNNTTPPADAGGGSDVQATDLGPATDARGDTGVRVDTGARPDTGAASRTAVIAGRRCTDDEMCSSETADLACTALPGGRICSGVEFCEQGTTAEEEAACGGRFSTCLVVGNFTNGTQASACTRACVPTANTEATGACPSGSICTTNWLQLNAMQTENAGCLPHCSSDADCAGITAGDASLMRCNVRTGRCASAPFDPALRPDGAACNPQEVQRTMVNQCRGICFSLSSMRPTEGLCGSFINLRTATEGCPDGAEIEPRAAPGDTLGICIFRNCESNADCSGGLLCVYPEDTTMGVRTDLPTTCGYRTTRQPNGIPGAGSDGGTPADGAVADAR